MSDDKMRCHFCFDVLFFLFFGMCAGYNPLVFLGGGNSKIFYFHPENCGNDSHFDVHIFQMGWFNHQLVFKSVLLFFFYGFCVCFAAPFGRRSPRKGSGAFTERLKKCCQELGPVDVFLKMLLI